MNIDKINVILYRDEIDMVAKEIFEHLHATLSDCIFDTLLLSTEDNGKEKAFTGIRCFDARSTYNSIRKHLLDSFSNNAHIAIATPFVDAKLIQNFGSFEGITTKPTRDWVVWTQTNTNNMTKPKQTFETKMIEIVSAKYDMNYRIALEFSDGKKRTVSLKQFVEGNENDEIRELEDIAEFKKFSIEHGGLHWANNSLSLSAKFLYDCDYYITTI